jgi:hypothetical protein
MNSGNGEPITPRTSPFESIRRQTEDGSEYWSARELGKILGYTEYGKFQNAVQKAETACMNSGQAVSDHFAHMSDMIASGHRLAPLSIRSLPESPEGQRDKRYSQGKQDGGLDLLQ